MMVGRMKYKFDSCFVSTIAGRLLSRLLKRVTPYEHQAEWIVHHSTDRSIQKSILIYTIQAQSNKQLL
jgi:hypothetical protein